jgi:hypothetical protein
MASLHRLSCRTNHRTFSRSSVLSSCPSSFRKEQVGQLATLLRDKHAVYFHGHEHNPDATFHGDGYLKTLGFGAVYANSLTADPDATYKNTFTFCKLTDRLEIRAFTWESKPGAWIETTDIQFNTCLSAKNAAGDKIRTANIPVISSAAGPTSRPVPANIPRTSAKPSGVILVDAPTKEAWQKVLMVSENIRRIFQQGEYKLSYLPGEAGKATIILTHGDTRCMRSWHGVRRRLRPRRLLHNCEVELRN